MFLLMVIFLMQVFVYFFENDEHIGLTFFSVLFDITTTYSYNMTNNDSSMNANAMSQVLHALSRLLFERVSLLTIDNQMSTMETLLNSSVCLIYYTFIYLKLLLKNIHVLMVIGTKCDKMDAHISKNRLNYFLNYQSDQKSNDTNAPAATSLHNSKNDQKNQF